MDSKEKTYKMSFVEYVPQKNGAYRTVENRNGKLVFVDKIVDKKTKKQKEKITALSKTEAKTALFASPYIDFSPRKITLKPKETQTIRLMLNKKAKFSNPTELRSHFYIHEKNKVQEAKPKTKTKGLRIDIHAQYGVTINLF